MLRKLAAIGAATLLAGSLAACVPAPPEPDPPPPPEQAQPPSPPASSCDPAYPGVCIPPAPPDLDCGDISFRNFPVLPPDPHGFDTDHDGIGCETP